MEQLNQFQNQPEQTQTDQTPQINFVQQSFLGTLLGLFCGIGLAGVFFWIIKSQGQLTVNTSVGNNQLAQNSPTPTIETMPPSEVITNTLPEPTIAIMTPAVTPTETTLEAEKRIIQEYKNNPNYDEGDLPILLAGKTIDEQILLDRKNHIQREIPSKYVDMDGKNARSHSGLWKANLTNLLTITDSKNVSKEYVLPYPLKEKDSSGRNFQPATETKIVGFSENDAFLFLIAPYNNLDGLYQVNLMTQKMEILLFPDNKDEVILASEKDISPDGHFVFVSTSTMFQTGAGITSKLYLAETTNRTAKPLHNVGKQGWNNENIKGLICNKENCTDYSGSINAVWKNNTEAYMQGFAAGMFTGPWHYNAETGDLGLIENTTK